MRLSIVIPVFNNANFTKACLRDLSELPDDHEIIVVDDASTDNTEEVVRSFERCKYVRNEKNSGFAFTVNMGYTTSSGKYVMFLNNDIRVKSDKGNWTENILSEADGKLVGPTGGLLDSSFNFIKEINKHVESPFFYMSGWNLTSDRSTWEKLRLPEYKGPFTEEFGTYFEDTDLSFRAQELKIPFEIVDVPVVHFGRQTTSKLGISSLYMPAKRKFIEKWKKRISKK